MIVITNILPKSQYGHVAAFRIGLKNDDSSRTAKGNIVGASNMKDALSQNKEAQGGLELPPHADEEIHIPWRLRF
jgi:hypothetical protein